MSKKYFIIGNSGFAKETLILAQSVLAEDEQFGGFIDHKPSSSKVKCLGKEFSVYDQDDFIKDFPSNDTLSLYLGIGDSKKIAEIALIFKGYSFPNLIHRNFVGHSPSIQMGDGNIITAGCVFTGDIIIGSFNIFNLNVTVGHDVSIGHFNVINPGVNISGSVNIGNTNLIGTNSTILQGIKIGNNSILGAGSLANRHIEDNRIMVGIPARPIQK